MNLKALSNPSYEKNFFEIVKQNQESEKINLLNEASKRLKEKPLRRFCINELSLNRNLIDVKTFEKCEINKRNSLFSENFYDEEFGKLNKVMKRKHWSEGCLSLHFFKPKNDFMVHFWKKRDNPNSFDDTAFCEVKKLRYRSDKIETGSNMNGEKSGLIFDEKLSTRFNELKNENFARYNEKECLKGTIYGNENHEISNLVILVNNTHENKEIFTNKLETKNKNLNNLKLLENVILKIEDDVINAAEISRREKDVLVVCTDSNSEVAISNTKVSCISKNLHSISSENNPVKVSKKTEEAFKVKDKVPKLVLNKEHRKNQSQWLQAHQKKKSKLVAVTRMSVMVIIMCSVCNLCILSSHILLYVQDILVVHKVDVAFMAKYDYIRRILTVFFNLVGIFKYIFNFLSYCLCSFNFRKILFKMFQKSLKNVKKLFFCH